jgi:hypothetical protein
MTRCPRCAARAAVLAAALLLIAALAVEGWQAYCLVAAGPRGATPAGFAAGWLALLAALVILSRVKVPGQSPHSAAPARKARTR